MMTQSATSAENKKNQQPLAAGDRAWLWVLLGAWIITAFGLQIHPLGDPDVYLHLRDGQYWATHGLAPVNDPFSYTAADQPMDRIERWFKLAAYQLYQWGGLKSLIIAKALCMTMAIVLLGALMYQRWPNWGVVGGLLALAFALPPMLTFFRERPYLATYMLLPAIWWLLEQHSRASRATWPRLRLWLGTIPVVTLVWTNIHPGFLVVFGYFAAYLLEHAWRAIQQEDKLAGAKAQDIAILIGLVFLAGACNPLGFGQYQYVVEHVRSNIFMGLIEEWNKPTWGKQAMFFIMLSITAGSQLLVWRQTRPSNLILLLGFGYLGLQAYRNLPLFYIACLPPLTENLHTLSLRYFGRQPVSRAIRRWGMIGGIVAAGLILGISSQTKQTLNLGLLPYYYAEDATQWLAQQPLQGRLMTQIHWAGYLSWKTQGRIKVFMDGRLAMFGEKVFIDFTDVLSGDDRHALPVLDKYDIQIMWVDFEKERKISQMLTESGQWGLVYFDDLSQVYVRRNGANQALLDKFEFKAIAPWKPTPYTFDLSVPGLALAEAQRAQTMAPHSYIPPFYEGQIQLNARDFKQARAAFTKVVKIDPRQYTAYYNLGYIASQEGKMAEARAYLDQALRFCPANSPHRARIIQLFTAVAN